MAYTRLATLRPSHLYRVTQWNTRQLDASPPDAAWWNNLMEILETLWNRVPLMIPFPPLFRRWFRSAKVALRVTSSRFIWDCLPTIITSKSGQFFRVWWTLGAHGGAPATQIESHLGSIKNFIVPPPLEHETFGSLWQKRLLLDRIIIRGERGRGKVGWLELLGGSWRAALAMNETNFKPLQSNAKVVISRWFGWIWKFRHPSFRTERVDSEVHQA